MHIPDRLSKVQFVNGHRVRGAAAVCAAALALAIASPPDVPASAASSIVPPEPSDPGGPVQVRPAGGGGCVIGLNCGCIRNITCPKAPAHPPGAVRDKRPDPAPAPQNP